MVNTGIVWFVTSLRSRENAYRCPSQRLYNIPESAMVSYSEPDFAYTRPSVSGPVMRLASVP